jgi:undecaprenyl-diphosphatase
LGAVAVELPDIARQSSSSGILPMIVAFGASFVVGWLSLLWLLRVIRHGHFHWFAPYCFAIGILTILWAR